MHLSGVKPSRCSYETFRRNNSVSSLSRSQELSFEGGRPRRNLEEDILNISLQLDQMKEKRPNTSRPTASTTPLNVAKPNLPQTSTKPTRGITNTQSHAHKAQTKTESKNTGHPIKKEEKPRPYMKPTTRSVTSRTAVTDARSRKEKLREGLEEIDQMHKQLSSRTPAPPSSTPILPLKGNKEEERMRVQSNRVSLGVSSMSIPEEEEEWLAPTRMLTVK